MAPPPNALPDETMTTHCSSPQRRKRRKRHEILRGFWQVPRQFLTSLGYSRGGRRHRSPKASGGTKRKAPPGKRECGTMRVPEVFRRKTRRFPYGKRSFHHVFPHFPTVLALLWPACPTDCSVAGPDDPIAATDFPGSCRLSPGMPDNYREDRRSLWAGKHHFGKEHRWAKHGSDREHYRPRVHHDNWGENYHWSRRHLYCECGGTENHGLLCNKQETAIGEPITILVVSALCVRTAR